MADAVHSTRRAFLRASSTLPLALALPPVPASEPSGADRFEVMRRYYNWLIYELTEAADEFEALLHQRVMASLAEEGSDVGLEYVRAACGVGMHRPWMTFKPNIQELEDIAIAEPPSSRAARVLALIGDTGPIPVANPGARA